VRNFFRIMAAVALAVMSIASIGGVAVAATGSIAGSVQADNLTPINGAHVVAYNWDTDMFVGEARALPDGTYSITGLPSGTYRVKADYVRYLPEYYYEGTAAPVSVTDTNATPNIDFTLTPGSSISGHVYQDDNITPINGARVVAYDNVTWEEVADGYADTNGAYSITTGTGSGSYFLRARYDGWDAEYYDNVSTQDAAIQVQVDAENDTPGKDFTLTQISYISGTVRRADGIPLGTASITAYENFTDPGNWTWAAQGHSGASGGYYYINLDEGTYKIKATAPGYIDQWWDNVTTRDAASLITVVGTTGVYPDRDFSLLTVQAVTTNPATNVATTSATLNGNLTSMGANDNVTVSFEWGTAPGSYTQTTDNQALSVTGGFSADLTTGLDPGTTYYFRAKAVGDVDPDPFYGEEKSFTASTTQPSVTTNDASNPATTSATLNGNLDSLGTAATVNVSFEWGTATGSYTQTTANQARTITGAFSADLAVGSLTPGTTYYYRAVADGDGPPVYGAEKPFTTLTTAPSVTTSAATNLATTSATLNGDLTSLGTATSVNVSFEWGLTISYGNTTTPEAKTATGTFSANLTGLTAKTTYHFRAIAVGDGSAPPGDDMTFTTSTIAPSVTTSAATNLATTTAALNGSLTALGTATSDNVSFQWGTTTSYGSETTAQSVSAIGTFSANLTGLSANTTYHFRAKAVGDGSAVYGDDMTFTTASLADTTAPEISLVNSNDITTTGATITWTTNEAATSQVEYGLTEEYGSTTTLDSTPVTSHSVDLTGLKAGKTYHYRVISKDAANNQAVSGDDTFTTAARSGGMPTWAWVIIGLGAVGVVGAAAYFISRRLAQG
jgi:hypothetical protein